MLRLLTRNRVGAISRSILVIFPDPRSLLLADSKVAELQQQLLATSTDLLSEKAQHEALKRLNQQQSQQQQETISRLEQENGTLQQQRLIRYEETEVRMQLLQSQDKDKEAVIIQLQVSSNKPSFSLYWPHGLSPPQESLSCMRQHVEHLQLKMEEAQQQHSLANAQRDAELRGIKPFARAPACI